jgi:hypothetical protein
VSEGREEPDELRRDSRALESLEHLARVGASMSAGVARTTRYEVMLVTVDGDIVWVPSDAADGRSAVLDAAAAAGVPRPTRRTCAGLTARPTANGSAWPTSSPSCAAVSVVGNSTASPLLGLLPRLCLGSSRSQLGRALLITQCRPPRSRRRGGLLLESQPLQPLLLDVPALGG